MQKPYAGESASATKSACQIDSIHKRFDSPRCYEIFFLLGDRSRLYTRRLALYLLDMELIVDNAAAKVLRRIQPKLTATIMKRMKAIVIDPFAYHPNVEPLQGISNGFRLRQGDWRVIYEVDTETQVVRVTKIGPRGQVYR